MNSKSHIAIVGAGPAGLFAAYHLLKEGFKVDIYDQSSGPGKKFLIAGNGGLNITHSEDLSSFVTRYTHHESRFNSFLNQFSPTDLRKWCDDLGINTFVGSSGRVFPKEMSAGKFLLAWLEKLKSFENFGLHLKHRLTNIHSDKTLIFETEIGEKRINSPLVIMALGGASWKKTGSDGKWKPLIESLEINVQDFLPMNCGFEVQWSEFFKKNVDRTHLKHVEIHFNKLSSKGDLMITPYGVEGGVIYALSNHIRDNIIKEGEAFLTLDLRPGLDFDSIKSKLEKRPKKATLSNHLRKALNFDKFSFMLLKEVLKKEEIEDMKVLAKRIKELPIKLTGTRPLDEAISTSGGVSFSELNETLESKKIPGLYFIGEMLDYEAPTGGYLLQGCFSTAYVAVQGILLNRPGKIK